MKYMRVGKARFLRPHKPKKLYCTIDGFKSVTVKSRLNRTAFVLGAVFCILLIALLIMLEIRSDVDTAEWWTTHIQFGWEKTIGALTSWLPFSVMEFFIVFGILFGLYLLARFYVNLCRGRFKRIGVGALALCVGAMYLFDTYILSMGFGYYRAPMPVPQAGAKYTLEQAKEVAEYYLEEFNALAEKLERDENGCVKCPYSFSDLAELMKEEYARLDGGYFSDYTPTAKPIVNSWFLSDMLITGITFLPFGEAGVNIAAPPTTVTVTTAHELAHAKGVQREGDANLLARYLLLSSENEYLRYCGLYGAFNNLLQTMVLFEDFESYNDIALRLSPLIYAERKYTNDYWRSQPDIIGKIAEFFNDLYLKANGAENGTGSYDDGNKTEIITPVDPDTGEPEKDPDTGEPVRIVKYSQVQMLFFWLYEESTGSPPAVDTQ